MKPQFNEKNIEQLLNELKKENVKIDLPPTFTASVMNRIRADETMAISYFESIYKKFLIGTSIAAAAAIIMALNFILSYDMSEYTIATMLSGTLF